MYTIIIIVTAWLPFAVVLAKECEPALGHGKKKNDGMYAIPTATEVGPACAISSLHAYIELTRHVSAVSRLKC